MVHASTTTSNLIVYSVCMENQGRSASTDFPLHYLGLFTNRGKYKGYINMVMGSAQDALHARGSAAISQLWLDRISIQGKRWAEDKSLMTGKRSHCTVLSVTCEVPLW